MIVLSDTVVVVYVTIGVTVGVTIGVTVGMTIGVTVGMTINRLIQKFSIMFIPVEETTVLNDSIFDKDNDVSDSSLYIDDAVGDSVVRELVEDTMLDSSKFYLMGLL